MDCENQEKDKDGNVTAPGAFNNGSTNNSECGAEEEAAVRVRLGFPPPPQSPSLMCVVVSCCVAGIQTIDSTQALFLPIGASVSLLVMFFFFDSVQVVFTICTAGETPVFFSFFCFFFFFFD